jgi:hypothetical protein
MEQRTAYGCEIDMSESEITGHLCNMLKDFLENIDGEWHENEEGIIVSVPMYRGSVRYLFKYCPFCFCEKLGE